MTYAASTRVLGSLSTIDLGDMATTTATMIATTTGLSLSTPLQLTNVMNELFSTTALLLAL
jgi:hypothetical protein